MKLSNNQLVKLMLTQRQDNRGTSSEQRNNAKTTQRTVEKMAVDYLIG